MAQIGNEFTEFLLIMPSTKIAQMVPQDKRAARAPDKKYLEKSSPPEPLVKIPKDLWQFPIQSAQILPASG